MKTATIGYVRSLGVAVGLSLLAEHNSPTANDEALRPGRVIVAPDASYHVSTRKFQGIPGVERSPGGRIWATWYAGGPGESGEGPGNYVVLVHSEDGGQSWSQPIMVVDPEGPVRAFDACLWTDPQGTLWWFWTQSHGAWDGRGGVWCMVTSNPDDATPVWSAPRRLCDGIMMNKPTVLQDGTWLLPASVWGCLPEKHYVRLTEPQEIDQHRHPILPRSERRAWALNSGDGGFSWERRGGVEFPQRSYDEHSFLQLTDGRLWMWGRVKNGISQSVSSDGGHTWTTPAKANMGHADSRFFLRRLASGNILLVANNAPHGNGRSHLTAWLSRDEGAHWEGGLLLDEREGVSYPDGFQNPDGEIGIIYDYNRTREMQICLVRFQERDILAPAGVPVHVKRGLVSGQEVAG